MAEFKDRLRELRIEKGLTQIQLAEELKMSRGTIGNYEAGVRKNLRLEDLEAVADYFNVEIDYLLGRTDKRPEFSLEEQWIMRCYKNADPETKSGIKMILRKFDQDTAFKVG